MLRLVGGVGAFDLVLLGVGYCLLAPALRRRSLLSQLTFAGVALLLGAAAVGVVLSGLAVAGLPTGPAVLGPTATILALAGLLVARLSPPTWLAWPALPQPPRRSSSSLAEIAATTGAYGVAAVCGLMVFASFRSSPWLDDSWTFWLPKGLALGHVGLDARAFEDNDSYLQFTSPDYPLWWSIITGEAVSFVRGIDLRAVDAQLGILVAAFFAAAARLLWGFIRPWILWPLLLLLAVSPELLHQSQSGDADLPLAVYLALTMLAAAGWLARRGGIFLVLTAIFAAAAASMKVEGAPQLIIFVALPAALVSRRAVGRVSALYAALAAGFVLASPWFVWSRVHGIRNEFRLSRALDPGYLRDHTARVRPSAHEIASQLTNVREWTVVVACLLVVTVLAWVVERRLVTLAPVAALAAACLFWVWVYWAGPIDLDFWLATSAYRVVDASILAAGLSIPMLAESIVRRLEGGRPLRRHPGSAG